MGYSDVVTRALPADGQTLEMFTEVTALFGRRGGYFFLLAAIKRPIMPTTKMPIWIRSEYVTIGQPPFPKTGGKKLPPQRGANRLPLLVAPWSA